MAESVQNQVAKELTVELINAAGKPEMKRFAFSADEGNQVNAGQLKQGLLCHFDETSAVLEPEEVADENRSYHLLGFDGQGAQTAFPDDESVDLGRYTHFQISPRTTGGGRRLRE